MGYTFLFPGQGSQKVGMGKDFYDTFDLAKTRIDSINDILGRDLKSVIFDGPDEDLKATQNTQPALFTIESAITDVLKDRGLSPEYVLGHSLGEYSAMYAAGIYSFEDGLRMVAKRGKLMAEAGKITPGKMAAIIGLSKEKIAGVLAKITDGVVVLANENTPVQTVISGEATAIEIACNKLKENGAKRAIILPVSGAFHSPLMQNAANAFKQFIEPISFSDATCPVISNVTAKPENDGNILKKLMIKQLLSPVKWVDSLSWLMQNNAIKCLEVGPGVILRGLAQKTDRSINVISCNAVDNLYSFSN